MEILQYHIYEIDISNAIKDDELPENIIKAAILSPDLKTLVAPGLFEPYFLGSSRPLIFEIMTANEIEPKK